MKTPRAVRSSRKPSRSRVAAAIAVWSTQELATATRPLAARVCRRLSTVLTGRAATAHDQALVRALKALGVQPISPSPVLGVPGWMAEVVRDQVEARRPRGRASAARAARASTAKPATPMATSAAGLARMLAKCLNGPRR